MIKLIKEGGERIGVPSVCWSSLSSGQLTGAHHRLRLPQPQHQGRCNNNSINKGIQKQHSTNKGKTTTASRYNNNNSISKGIRNNSNRLGTTTTASMKVGRTTTTTALRCNNNSSISKAIRNNSNRLGTVRSIY